MSRGTTALAVSTVVPAKERADRELVRDARNGDDTAFGCLYDRYRRRISSYAYGMVKDHARAEDITQDVFISALRRMRDTDRPIAFKPWIYEIARNACIDHFRRGKRAEEVPYDSNDGHAGADQWLVTAAPSPEAMADTKQQLNDLCGAFGGLSETHHQILLLRELEGLSYREIGERMGLSRPAVESTLFRARRRLNEEYDDLVSGRRCQRTQSIIAAAAEGMLGARDRRRMMRHLAHCQSCRSEARLMGVDEPLPRRSVAASLKALLPLPWFLRGGHGAEQGAAGASGRDHATGAVVQLAASVGPQLEPLTASWVKAAVAAVTIAAAGVGAGVATTPPQNHTSFPWAPSPISLVHQDSRSVPDAGHLRAVQRVFAHAPAVGASRTAVTLATGERLGGAGARGSDRGPVGGATVKPTDQLEQQGVDLKNAVSSLPEPAPSSPPHGKLPSIVGQPGGSKPAVLHQVTAVTRAAAGVPSAVTHTATGGSSQSSSSTQSAPAQPAPTHHHSH